MCVLIIFLYVCTRAYIEPEQSARDYNSLSVCEADLIVILESDTATATNTTPLLSYGGFTLECTRSSMISWPFSLCVYVQFHTHTNTGRITF